MELSIVKNEVRGGTARLNSPILVTQRFSAWPASKRSGFAWKGTWGSAAACRAEPRPVRKLFPSLCAGMGQGAGVVPGSDDRPHLRWCIQPPAGARHQYHPLSHRTPAQSCCYDVPLCPQAAGTRQFLYVRPLNAQQPPRALSRRLLVEKEHGGRAGQAGWYGSRRGFIIR